MLRDFRRGDRVRQVISQPNTEPLEGPFFMTVIADPVQGGIHRVWCRWTGADGRVREQQFSSAQLRHESPNG